ncbi:PREDICTED: putative high mobility group protein B1-like 1 [Atta cephalotes]|uniref:HMG box domain-containing protein n=2 Tax=Atta TaxID=12956 RepID=A0A158NED3_ATTCE|nr:PREDICTED: putative high mobility group protein B1-like 1 [Atta cephalotes]XP_018051430.1 PREDICTED: putative high mobility group protein B1-like 1 [Atta colombica]XP_018051438.1 PREDICTED: putative high mobility group protein B1-like 1 [Atta colombica]XP_018051447.1 PREDICTED: putative high mobility group protein B1-like 1 [Atta colombica]XP_018051458.1 PREDICTED: putative high mobility group protein B1-like 1 [Atta colombica]XP_018051466.1 PREDICTED: putative high mobility group protein B
MESSDSRKNVYLTKTGDNSLNSGMRETMIVGQANMVPECAEGVMKPNNVSNVSANQTKWTNGGSKNYITIPVKNEVVHLEDGNAHCNNKKMYYYDRHYTGHEEPERPTRRGTKRYRDKDAPKRALSAFFYFCQELRGKMRELHPEMGVGDIAKELGKLWMSTDLQTKSKYMAIAEEDRARYEREIIAYNKRVKNYDPEEVGTV